MHKQKVLNFTTVECTNKKLLNLTKKVLKFTTAECTNKEIEIISIIIKSIIAFATTCEV